jgi:alpha-L-rhamnosidase
LFFTLVLWGQVVVGQPMQDSTFLHPPAAAKPWVFWYWMQAAVSKAGIHADLQAMAAAGIGGAYLMPINGVANPPIYTPAVEQLSPAWWEMVRYAMQQADSLGLQLAMHACDGFAVAGGPWITPALSMQKVVWTRTDIEGGQTVDLTLPQPETNEKYYEDVAVLAFPTPAGWEASTRTIVPKVTKDTATILYAFDRPFTCRTITIHAANNYQAQRLLVEVSDDGQHFRSLGRLVPPRHGWQDGDAAVTHSIPAVTARYFRFVYDKTGSEPGAEDLDAAKWKPSLKFSEIELSATPGIDQFEGKNGEVWRVSARTTAEQLPDSLCIDPRTVIDLGAHRVGRGGGQAGAHVNVQGHLVWQAPPGHWTVLRIGHTSTGHTNATGGAAKGLECDKFNPRAIELQFDRWFGETIRQAGPALAGRVLKIFHVDSWECGSQNWSPVFREEFRRRRGYDLLRWLPAMAGFPIGSADNSERFLHDIRQTITELLHDEFYMTMARLAHDKGCQFSAESVAPTMVGDGMLHYDVADIPMGEFWLRSPTHDKPNDMLDAISGAHIYGKPVVQAEAFTELRLSWDEHPGMLKTLQDRNYALGINRMVFHVFTHNPWLDRKPGMTLNGVGTFLQRDQTWWPDAVAWVDYTRRCQWLLQQGSPVADIAVFAGEEIPRRAVLPERLVTTLPGLFGAERVKSEQLRLQNTGEPTTKAPNGVSHSANMAEPQDWIDPLHGYAFDSFNPDALLHLAKVRNGRVEFPGGASYALLVLPGAYPFSPDPGMISAPVAQRLLQLVKEGATLLIADTTAVWHSTGLEHARESDDSARGVFRELLGAPGSALARVGKGRVIKGPYTDSSLEAIGIARDFIATEPGIAYTHRSAPGMEIYFVSNQLDRARDLTVSFRNSGWIPECWDAVTGKITPAGWSPKGDRTLVKLYLPASGSVFIVLRRPLQSVPVRPVLVPVTIHRDMDKDPIWLKTLSDPWMVGFDPAAAGPAQPVRFDSLTDWSHHTDSAIRYYSGTAVYHQSFDWNDKTGENIYLDLGKVDNIARVTLNGIDCGIVWTPPYRVDISKMLRKGANELKIEVTNTWANRLTGDQRLPELKRITWTIAPYHPDGQLLPAGLLGPVRLVR